MVERWIPRTYKELVEALVDGRIEENHHLDFKREIASGKAANRELAKDLAAFANDGGNLIIGVAEPQGGQFTPHPIALSGLPERIEQVAANNCHPPLRVEVRTIPLDTDPSQGVIVVRVPVSPEAPHMVNDRYHGRVGRTSEILSDSQVKSITTGRREALEPILKLLAADVERDPIPDVLRRNGHLHAVGRPRFSRDDLVLASVEALANGNWSQWFHNEFVTRQMEPRIGSWVPDLGYASNVGRRAHGGAMYSEHMGQDRAAEKLIVDPELLERHEGRLLDIEVDEDGTIHMFCGRGVDQGRGDGRLIIKALVAGLPLRIVQLSNRVNELTGFVGTWDFVVEINGLRSAVPSGRDVFGYAPAYSADVYRQAAAADTAEIADSPFRVADRLVSRLLRSLGVDGGVQAVFGNTG